MDTANWHLLLQLGAGAIGASGGALINHWLAVRRETLLKDSERDREARYVAIRVVCALDLLVSACVDVVHDGGSPDAEDCIHADVAEPTIVIPTDVDWRSIEASLMYRTLGLPNEINSASRQIAAVGEYVAGPPDYEEFFWERQIEFGQIGLRALTLAEDYRKVYKIPPFDRDGYDVRAALDERVNRAQREKAEDDRRRTALRDRLNAQSSE